MFKIHYEHKGGYFCFQVPYLWLFWQKVQIESEDGTDLIILKFKSIYLMAVQEKVNI